MLNNQKGAVSIYVSVVVMVLLSLIAFSFAYLMTRHFLQVQENQYSMLAYYAAETGINDALDILHEQIIAVQQGGESAVAVEQSASSSLEGKDGDVLGRSLATTGNLLAVSGQNKAYVLNRSSSSQTWQLGSNPTTLSRASSTFDSLALDKDTLVVGDMSGQGAHFYTPQANSGWQASGSSVTTTGNNQFGRSVFLRGDMLLVGNPGANNQAGAVHYYEFDVSSSRYQPQATLTLPSLKSGDRFGHSLSYAGGWLAVSAPGSSQVFVIQKTSSGWDGAGALTIKDRAGRLGQTANHLAAGIVGDSVLLEGNLLFIGDASQQVVHILQRRGQGYYWHKQLSRNAQSDSNFQVKDLGQGEQFGASLAKNGQYLIVGAPGFGQRAGKVYFLKLTNNELQDYTDLVAAGDNCPDEEDIDKRLQRGQRLDEDGNVGYSCVIVDLTPPDLIYDAIDTDRSIILPLEPVNQAGDNVELEQLTIEWDQTDIWSPQTTVRPTVATDDPVPPLTDIENWGVDVPLLRLQITIVDLSQSFSRDTLNRNTEVFFLYPSAGYAGDKGKTHPNYGGKTAAGANLRGPGEEKKVAVLINNCRNDNPTDHKYICKAIIDDLPSAADIGGSSQGNRLFYVVRIKAYYREARLRVSGSFNQGAEPQAAGFKNIQAAITATGRVKNIFERLQKRIPLRPVYDIAEYGIDSAEDVCKVLANTDVKGSHVYVRDLDLEDDLIPEDLPRACWLREEGNKADWQED